MSSRVTTTWQENMVFETEVSGHKFLLDADESVGGENKGPKPMPLLLTALSGCTGMDVIYVLRKMRIIPTYFKVGVDASITEEYPKHYDKIHLVYEFNAKDGLDEGKVETAVRLSQEKYCGVNALLRKGAEVTYEIRYM